MDSSIIEIWGFFFGGGGSFQMSSEDCIMKMRIESMSDWRHSTGAVSLAYGGEKHVAVSSISLIPEERIKKDQKKDRLEKKIKKRRRWNVSNGYYFN